MESTSGFKLLEEGYEGVALTKMFPAKGFYPSASGGAWYAAKLLEDQTRMGQRAREGGVGEVVRSYSRLKKQRRRDAKMKRLYEKGEEVPLETQSEVDERENHMDGFFLLRIHGVSDPGDLSAIDISGRPLETANEEDMELFENVIYINAAETFLPFETYNHFPSLRELEAPLCALRTLRVNMNDFESLELLDLSYNNLSPEDVASLSILPRLRALYLSGNQLTYLPDTLCSNVQFKSDESASNASVELEAFPCLEVLHLDDNQFTEANTLAVLAGLRHLKYLSLDNNQISAIPYIKIKRGKPIQRVHVNAVEFKVEDDQENNFESGVDSADNLLDDILNLDEEQPDNALSSDPKLTNSLAIVEPGSGVDPDVIVNKEEKSEDLAPAGSVSNDGEAIAPVNSLVNPQKEDQSDQNEERGFVPPAFEELRILSIAYNQISSEDAVLPVVGWPMLQEVNIAGNPLVNKHNGEPPLLNRYLTNRLGITLKRFELPQKSKAPQELERPTIKPPTYRKIPEVPPPAKRVPIDFMAIEYPGVFDPLPSKENTLDGFEARKEMLRDTYVPQPVAAHMEPPSLQMRSMSAAQNAPLPPIPTSPKSGDSSRPRSGPEDLHHMRFAPMELNRLETKEIMVPKFAPKANVAPEKQRQVGEGQLDQEPFFLTQVDEYENADFDPRSQNEDSSSRRETVRHSHRKGGPHSKQRGPFELLYQTNEDEEKFSINLPKDVQSNVKALKYALKHPVSFSETPASHERIMHLYQPDKHKRPSKPKKVQQTKTELFYDTLAELKNRVAYVETNLEKALVDTDRHRVAQVKELVQEIQDNYKQSSGSKSSKL